MSNQNFFDEGNLPAPDLETLSGEGGSPVGPLGHNFNFSGSIAGGAAANGAILFNPTTPGEMDAAVQVDNKTIIINASNQLQSTESLIWQIIALNQTALVGAGYFINVGQSVTLTLPAAPTIGQMFAVYALNGSTWTLQCNAGQQIQVNDVICGSGGTVTSTNVGDFIFVLTVSSTSFVACPFSGNFLTT